MDDELKEQIDTLHARLDAWRAAFTVLVMAIGDAIPNAKDEIMLGLEVFEAGMRRTNERAEVLQELRAVRECVTAVEMREDLAAVA